MTKDRPNDIKRETKPGKGKDASPKEADKAGGERIAKRLARAGVASRRDAEAMIEAGRVSVNGKVLVSPAFNVSASDRILVDGEPLPAVERTRLFLFHKPGGVVTTNRDPEGRKTIFDVLPEGLPRLITVGRLDINTEGLIVLTNDGGLARALELPETGWLRRYRVRVHGKVDATALESLKDGIAVDGVFYGAIEATLDREQGSNAWLTLGLREGKNREVKNVLGALGLEVTRLIRISYGPFQLGTLGEGEVQEVKGRTLRDQLGERLIEKAGANFDAPIVNPFSNKPVRAERKPREGEAAEKQGGREREGGKTFVKNRKRDREEKREAARDRLQTTRPGRREDDRGPRQNRGSHVWMAPGARPQGKRKQVAAETETDERSQTARKPRREGGAQTRGDKPFRPRGDKPFDRDRPERGERGDNRPRFSKGDKPEADAREKRPFRSRDDRPASGDKPRFSKSGRPSGKPAGKPGGKPGAGKSFGKPGGKPSGKPAGRFSGKPGGASRPGKSRPGGRKPGKPGGEG
ncbi:pseudouridine synthase [Nitratireductor sp.]|uniref:pseudouridine synthase n=1 Tax=Nitratireductor sp. TaxID=1872084 RepID=UPI0025D0B298|nr:pseudouridine synthase [Nitratireductor sp.]